MGLLGVMELFPRAGFSAGTKPQTTSSSYSSRTNILHFWNQNNFLIRALQSSLSSGDAPDGDLWLHQKRTMGREVQHLPTSTALVCASPNLLIKSTVKDTRGTSLLEPNRLQIECFFPQKPFNIVNSFSTASRAFHRAISSPLPLLVSRKEVPFGFQRVAWSSPRAMGMFGEEDRPLKL